MAVSQRRKQWQPTLVLLPGKSHGWRSLVGCRPWGHEESDTTDWLHFHALEKEMATHSSVLTWRIPGTGELGGLPSMGSHRVGHYWSDLAAAAEYLVVVLRHNGIKIQMSHFQNSIIFFIVIHFVIQVNVFFYTIIEKNGKWLK